MITYGCSVPLSNERKRFQEEIALVRRVDEDPLGSTSGYPVAYIPYTPSYTEKCKPCLLCGMFGARSSSGTDHNISRKECVTLVDAWGYMWLSRVLFRIGLLLLLLLFSDIN